MHLSIGPNTDIFLHSNFNLLANHLICQDISIRYSFSHSFNLVSDYALKIENCELEIRIQLRTKQIEIKII